MVDKLDARRRAGQVFRTKQDVASWALSGDLSPAEAMVFARMAVWMDVRSTCFRGDVRAEAASRPGETARIVFVYDRLNGTKVYWHEF